MIRLLHFLYRKFILFTCVRRNVVYSSDIVLARRSFISAPNRLTIGTRVSIGMNCWIAVDGRIGNGVLISSHVGIIGRRDHDHRATGRRMTDAPWIYDGFSPADSTIDIGDDVWIGFGSIILSGVTIGRGAVVAAGAVVTKDIGPYDIVAGNPARKISTRFSPQEIAEHETGLQAAYVRDTQVADTSDSMGQAGLRSPS